MSVKTKPIYECRCDERLKTKAEESTRLSCTWLIGELLEIYGCLLFIKRVKRDPKRVYRNGCRYNERLMRLNTETGGSKTPHTY
jgi:hypothetical protein